MNSLEGEAPFRYLRLREPPYDDADLAAWAQRLRPLLDEGVRVYCYFKHEDEPTGPLYAERLLELLAPADFVVQSPAHSPVLVHWEVAVKVVIFCGGQGMRLETGNFSERLPKPMASLGGRPLLWHIMRYYAHFGHQQFVLCLGYRANAIQDYFQRPRVPRRRVGDRLRGHRARREHRRTARSGA